MARSLRVALRADDPVRRRGLAAMLEAAGHVVVEDTPDVVLCDVTADTSPPTEAEGPVLALADDTIDAAGVLPRGVEPGMLDPALRAVAAGLLVRVPSAIPAPRGFRAAEEAPALTPREAEVLALVGQGMSNKAVARRLGISLHTVKFHLEALFEKLGASSRAQAVAIGLRGGVIEL